MPILSPTPETIAAAASILRDGGVVAMPTETVYGLAADATSPDAVLSIYAKKHRPRFNPLIIHVHSAEAAFALTHAPAAAEVLAERFWPGPLTLVLRARAGNGIADIATAGLDTLAVRCPDHPVAQALILGTGRPLAAPSANRSGRLSPTTAEDVATDFDEKLTILDGGPCQRGIESTILDLTGPVPVVLRAGSCSAPDIAAALAGSNVQISGPDSAESNSGTNGQWLTRGRANADRPSAPGQLASHYAPRAFVRLEAHHIEPGEGLLAFGPAPPPHEGPAVNLSVSGDLAEAARTLFSALRRLDAKGVARIAVMPIPETGLGEAINDRLRRAAAPRDGS